MALYGLDPLRFLRTNDSLERLAMQKILQEAIAFQDKLDERRAALIANKVGELFRK
jgi:hypothetical protein